MGEDQGAGLRADRRGEPWEHRRAHRRVSVDAEVWIGQEGIFTRTTERLSDLSPGGAFLEIPGQYAVGSLFELRIALGGRFINSTVIVRRTQVNQGIGVQFLDLSPESLRHLTAFLQAAEGKRAGADRRTGFET